MFEKTISNVKTAAAIKAAQVLQKKALRAMEKDEAKRLETSSPVLGKSNHEELRTALTAPVASSFEHLLKDTPAFKI